MAVNYVVRAEVIEISSDTPKPDDTFLVDTNIWFWTTYPNASNDLCWQRAQTYPEYLNEAFSADASICHSVLTLAELAHIIERTERKIFSGFVKKVETKEYRHNYPNERIRIAQEVRAAWQQVCNLSDSLVSPLDATTAFSALDRLQGEAVDGYDLFILEAMKANGIVQIITDDGDFTSVSGIQVFTENRNVLQAAREQGQLRKR